MPLKILGSNIIKLDGYGLYVTYIDSNLYISEIMPNSGMPTLDPDKNISWDELKDPPNQKFLNLINAVFGTSFKMHDFGNVMSISDIKEFARQQAIVKGTPMTENEALWLVKNLREKEK